jgi:hypothetical protein
LAANANKKSHPISPLIIHNLFTHLFRQGLL